MDNTGFDTIFSANHDRIFRFLSRNVGKEHAEDLTQTVFLKVHKNLEKFSGKSSATTWIYRIATNEMIDLMRKQKKEKILKCELSDKDLFCLSDGAYISEELRLVKEEMKECICSYMKQLPMKYHTALVLKEYENLSNPQIAEVFNTTTENINKILYRARKKLRMALETACRFYYNEKNEFSCVEVSNSGGELRPIEINTARRVNEHELPGKRVEAD